ncbi:hypothetical protein [Amylolactobacillus amylophilus]|uniref:hypothetical protein n=1 Tax=Amylolactobacillus amylophilus TaxID=1603 RepID=UPI0006D04353|nr:hypothetical protein [Amylolactobacillus amylophilus]
MLVIEVGEIISLVKIILRLYAKIDEATKFEGAANDQLSSGAQSANIQQEIINEMVEHYRANTHQMHFLIVPNHIKFGTEVAALKTLSARSNREEVSVKKTFKYYPSHD